MIVLLLVVVLKYRINSFENHDGDQVFKLIVVIPMFQNGRYLPHRITRSMLGSLNKLQIDFLLRSEMVGRIGCSAGGMTYVVPITYVYDGKHILAHTREGLKIEMMRENPMVCFEVDYVENMANWQSVIIQGQFEELKGKPAEETIQLLVNRLHPIVNSETMVPRHALAPHKTPITHDIQMVVFRIVIKDVTGKFEKQ